jgi:hypothetical protein
MTKYRFPILVPFCVGLWDLGKFGKAGGIFWDLDVLLCVFIEESTIPRKMTLKHRW